MLGCFNTSTTSSVILVWKELLVCVMNISIESTADCQGNNNHWIFDIGEKSWLRLNDVANPGQHP